MQGPPRRRWRPLPESRSDSRRRGKRRSRWGMCSLLQSAGYHSHVIFLSARYLSAPALIMGFRLLVGLVPGSDEKFHFLPVQVCTRDQVEPMWCAQLVDGGASRPLNPSASSLLLVQGQVFHAQRTCSPVMTLPLPKRSCARRTLAPRPASG